MQKRFLRGFHFIAAACLLVIEFKRFVTFRIYYSQAEAYI